MEWLSRLFETKQQFLVRECGGEGFWMCEAIMGPAYMPMWYRLVVAGYVVFLLVAAGVLLWRGARR